MESNQPYSTDKATDAISAPSTEWLLAAIESRRAAPVIIFLLEAHRPLRAMAESLLQAGEYALRPVLGRRLFETLQELFSSSENIDRFLAKLETRSSITLSSDTESRTE